MQKFSEQARALYEEYQSVMPPEIMSVIDNAMENHVATGIGENCASVGDKVNDFILPDAYGRDVQLSELLKRGPVVLSFYRGGWCTFCNLELKALQDNLSKIHATGAQLVAITPQKPDSTRETLEELGLNYPVLTDKHNRVASTLGLVFEVADELKKLYETTFNLNIPAENLDDSYRLPVTATYVVNPSGIIVSASTNADFTCRQDPEDIIRILETLQSECEL